MNLTLDEITDHVTQQVLTHLQQHYRLVPKKDVAVVVMPEHIMDRVIDVACSFFAVTREELTAKKRKQELCDARFMLMHLFVKEVPALKTSLARIGQALGGRDHANVLYGVKQHLALCETDELYNRTYQSLRHDALKSLEDILPTPNP